MTGASPLPEAHVNAIAEGRAEGRFEKRLVRPAKQYGQYRGPGLLEVDEAGLRIVGKHVYSLAARWGFGLALVIGSLILTSGTFVLGGLGVYFIVEFWWLKREEILVPFSAITGVGVDENQTTVAVSFDGHPWCSPAVLKTPKWRQLADSIEQRLQTTPDGGRAAALELSSAPVNRMARAGLTFGIASIVVVLPVAQTIFAFLGFATSVAGQRRARTMNGLGARAARNGLICSAIGLVISLLVLWFLFTT